MKVFSFTQNGSKILPVEVELSLLPGLPQVQFTGLPDAAIKESAMRIKSAIRAQGFEWPKTRQMIINLRPAHLKKNSKGVELAIACALLWKTGQLKPPHEMSSPFYIYGELLLDGSIVAPEDWESLPAPENALLTGRIEKENYLCPLFQASCLKELNQPVFKSQKPLATLLKKPELPDIKFSEGAAHILAVTAAGEHSLLLAGQAGSGKSTLAEHLHHLLPPPSLSEFQEVRRLWSQSGKELTWRPFVSPHHTTPALSMIGGGYPVYNGEITRAHGGILFMDEYLEFYPRVQEALREPMEKGKIYVSRRGQNEEFPARFLLVAATNLCPCGDLVPGEAARCAYSLRKCFSHMNRLSGPMLDRFDLLSFSTKWKQGPLSISLKEINERVQNAHQFRIKRGQELPNSKLSLQELESTLSSFLKDTQLSSSMISSKRRRKAVLKVARTLADLDQEKACSIQHIEQAKELSLVPFVQIKQRGEFP